MEIFIIIPVHNRKERTRDCLLSLGKQAGKPFHTIVVDDGSSDGTAEMIASEFPTVEILSGNGNLWWSGSTNLGIEHAMRRCNPDDYVLLLNDDLVIPEGFIERAYCSALKHQNTLIGSVVVDLDDKNTIITGGVIINWNTAKFRDPHQGKKLSDFSPSYIMDVSTLTGRGVLIPIEVFNKVGLYNAKRLVQCGDTELPVRATRAGYRLIVDYSMIVYNNGHEKTHISYRDFYRLSDAKDYFFSIKSHTYLKNRFWFAISTSPNIVKAAWFLLLDLIRLTTHFLRRLRIF